MKQVIRYSTVAIAALIVTASAFAQEVPPDRLSVSFSDPARPGLLKVSVLAGGITVTGYDGKEVVVEATVRAERESRHERAESKARGMRRLEVTSTNLTVEEEDNEMTVGVGSINRTVDLNIKVPKNTSLKLSSVNDGDIKVDQIVGEIDVNNTNGAVTLTNIAGAVVAHALNEDVIVTLVKIDPEKPMSFSSLNGDLDVTFPADLNARLKLKSDNGAVFSDFDIRMEPTTQKFEENSRKGTGKYRVRLEKSMFGTVGKGGPEIQFNAFNGNIYIRKAK